MDGSFRTLGVVGAGNMGSGIAQKMAMEGFDVVMVDVDEAGVKRGTGLIEANLVQAVERRVLTPAEADAARARIRGSIAFDDLAAADLVVEAVFEDLDAKRGVFRRLEAVCRPDAILATNTSSFSVTEMAEDMKCPERMLGLHYFFHPAKNRLVEVVRGVRTSEEVARHAWTLQELLGKTAIASRDSSGFVVNRYFVPWLVEAIRLLDEGLGTPTGIDRAAKEAFDIGMGPFELMNVTGIPMALHAATTLARAFGPMYSPPALLRRQVESGQLWALERDALKVSTDTIADRLHAVAFLVAGALVDEGVGSLEDADIGARVGLRWKRGPFELMNSVGVVRSVALVVEQARRWGIGVPRMLAAQAERAQPFEFQLVRVDVAEGIATLTLNRPDALNALNETVVSQLRNAFDAASQRDDVRGIVIGGAGKAFVAGADIKFFIERIEANDLDRVVSFTRAGQELLRRIETSAKPVVARLQGLALGGGLELALACHRIVASSKSAVAFPETGIGIYPGLGGTQRTTRRVGRGLARWLVFTGQVVAAEEAAAIGLVDAVVPPEQLDAAVRRALCDVPTAAAHRELTAEHRVLAEFFERHDPDSLRRGAVETAGNDRLGKAMRRMAGKAPIALRIAGELIDRGAPLPIAEALELEMERLTEVFSTRDAYVGLCSVGGKPPVFEGR